MRNNQQQFDLNEMEGNVAFGFWQSSGLTSPFLDPTIGQFQLSIKRFNITKNNYEIIKEIELTSLSKDTHPEYFFEGSLLNNFYETNGFYTAKNFSEIVLQDNAQQIDGT